MQKIAVNSITKIYDNKYTAVDSVSFEVKSGEIYGLLGPNGAGKTTTLRILAAMLTPNSGRIHICGYDVLKEPEKVKAKIGFLSGDTGLYARLTPVEMLRYFGRLNRMNEDDIKKRIEEIITAFDITEFKNKRCEHLSTGQKQRVSIARTVFHSPDVLILDEPTAGLDVISSQYILNFIRKERDKGKSILFSTHNMSEAELLCDRIGLLHKGRLLDEGTLPQLKNNANKKNLTEVFLHYAQKDKL